MSDLGVVLAPKKNLDISETRTLPVDILVLCTGWTAVSPMFSPTVASNLGLAGPQSEQQTEAVKEWSDLDNVHDQEVVEEFPLLRAPPSYRHAVNSQAPNRLYQAMMSVQDLKDHSIIFLGKLVIGNHFRAAEIQALWAVAYLDGNISVSEFDARLSISKTVAWYRRRYLNRGQMGNWFFFDAVDYTDMLLAELGLISHRQKGWLGNFFAPCKGSDLKHLVTEYKAKHPPSMQCGN